MTTEAEATPAAESTPIPFRAEVKQLLNILAHSLYTEREIFLRELISNASDALYRVQFEMVTNHDVLDSAAELAIHVDGDENARTVTISDSGIGMTREELIENLGTIAQSGARAIMERLEAGQRSDIIGQFGVGFYSAFVVADQVTVISRSFQPDAEATQWRSSGGDTFAIEPAEKAERGTTIILKLKDDALEFAKDWKLKQVIKRHSDFVAWPVYVGSDRANQQTALWRQAPRNVEADKYPDFYRQLTMDFEEPLLHLHLSTDVPVDLHTILFVPGKRERGIIERRVEGKIKLYSRKVLIQEDAKDLLPNYYRFVEGVVDSEDLPLNVSREMVQSNPVLSRIKKTLTGRLTKELSELAEKDSEKYATFWAEFGVFLKEGVATEMAARDELLPLLRFHTTKSGDALASLANYADRMGEGQEEIYYVLGSDLSSVRRSPHLEALEERGLEALLLADVMDGFMLQGLREYAGHKLRNIDEPNLNLPGDSTPADVAVSDESFGRLVTRFKDLLGERVSAVRASNVLRNSPARLVSPEDAPNREMERIQRMLDRDYKIPARSLELNRGHALIANLAHLIDEHPDDPLITPLVEQIYESALLLEGLHPNPAEMVGRIQTLMEAAARRSETSFNWGGLESLRPIQTSPETIPSQKRMNMPRHRWIWLAFTLPLAACMFGLWLTPLSLLPRHALAKSRWEAQGIRHYRLTAQLVQGGDMSGPWAIEIRDEHVIAGFDTSSGALLDRTQLSTAQRVLPIRTLFNTIRDEINTPRLTSTFALLTRIARLGPPLREQLNHCAARLPTIVYEPAYGYPRSVTVYGSPCVLRDNWTVLITDLTPIP